MGLGQGAATGGWAPWYARPRALQAMTLLLALLLLANAVLSLFFKVTDFEWHLQKGHDFWTLRPYPDKAITYLLPRFLLDGLVAWMEPRWARAVVYPLAVALLAWSALTCRRLAAQPGDPPWLFWPPLLLALLVIHPYLARDLNDCGPQIVTLACLLGAYLALRGRRPWLAGLLLATAIVWKVTPALFLGYLLLKRQWSALAATLLFTGLWLLLPALVLGLDQTLAVYRQWGGQLVWMLGQADLTVSHIEPPRHHNQGLRLLVARYTMDFGPEHPIHRDGNLSGNPLYVTFLELAPAQAQRVYQAVVLGLGALFAWRFRHRWSDARAGSELREWSAVLLLMTLLSPLAWLQHFAVALPAAVIVARDLLLTRGGGWRPWLAGCIAVVLLLLQRDVVQRELSLLVLSYKLDAFAMWGLVALVLLPPPPRSSCRSDPP